MEGYVAAAAAAAALLLLLGLLEMEMVLVLPYTEFQEIVFLKLRERRFQQWFSYMT